MSTAGTTSDRIKQILTKRIGMPADAISAEAKLVDDLSVDSLDFVELIMAAEQEFDIAISEERFQGVKTVADIVALVDQLMQERVTAG